MPELELDKFGEKYGRVWGCLGLVFPVGDMAHHEIAPFQFWKFEDFDDMFTPSCRYWFLGIHSWACLGSGLNTFEVAIHTICSVVCIDRAGFRTLQEFVASLFFNPITSNDVLEATYEPARDHGVSTIFWQSIVKYAYTLHNPTNAHLKIKNKKNFMSQRILDSPSMAGTFDFPSGY